MSAGDSSSVSDGDSPFVSMLTQRDCPHLTHFTVRINKWTQKDYFSE